jgi:hypothetical protein
VFSVYYLALSSISVCTLKKESCSPHLHSLTTMSKYVRIGHLCLNKHKIMGAWYWKRWVYWSHPYKLTIQYNKPEQPIYVGNQYAKIPIGEDYTLYELVYKTETEAESECKRINNAMRGARDEEKA